jgi:ADP-ribose pyrophosphatase
MEKELNRKTIYDGAIMQVTKEEVLCENGKHAYREVVYHHGGVCILAIKDNQIILVKQFRYPNRIETLEIPAGKLEKDEDPKSCAFRELEEETNQRAKDMKFLLKVLPSPGYTSEWLHLYEAIDFKEVNDALEGDDDEFIDVIYMNLEEAYQKVLDGTIVDAKTVIAIMYAYNKKTHK